MKGMFPIALAAAALALGACSKKNCEIICDCIDEHVGGIGGDLDETNCVDECRRQYKEDKECRKAIREAAKCIDSKGCWSAYDLCEYEYEDVNDNCYQQDWVRMNDDYYYQ